MFDDSSLCDVVKAVQDNDGPVPGFMLPRIPKEPCFKPLTNREWASFISIEQYIQKENLKIIRFNSLQSKKDL